MHDFKRYEAMRDNGLSQWEVYLAAKEEGVELIALIRLLRHTFQLSFVEAVELIHDYDSMTSKTYNFALKNKSDDDEDVRNNIEVSKEYDLMENKFNKILLLSTDLLSGTEIEEVMHFVDVGEYGVALETLCAILSEEHISISSDIYSLIDDLGTLMLLDKNVWKDLEALIKK